MNIHTGIYVMWSVCKIWENSPIWKISPTFLCVIENRHRFLLFKIRDRFLNFHNYFQFLQKKKVCGLMKKRDFIQYKNHQMTVAFSNIHFHLFWLQSNDHVFFTLYLVNIALQIVFRVIKKKSPSRFQLLCIDFKTIFFRLKI